MPFRRGDFGVFVLPHVHSLRTGGAHYAAAPAFVGNSRRGRSPASGAQRPASALLAPAAPQPWAGAGSHGAGKQHTTQKKEETPCPRPKESGFSGMVGSFLRASLPHGRCHSPCGTGGRSLPALMAWLCLLPSPAPSFFLIPHRVAVAHPAKVREYSSHLRNVPVRVCLRAPASKESEFPEALRTPCADGLQGKEKGKWKQRQRSMKTGPRCS